MKIKEELFLTKELTHQDKTIIRAGIFHNIEILLHEVN